MREPPCLAGGERREENGAGVAGAAGTAEGRREAAGMLGKGLGGWSPQWAVSPSQCLLTWEPWPGLQAQGRTGLSLVMTGVASLEGPSSF